MKGEILFKDVAFILAFVTSVLYVLGVTFCQGYLLHLGLEESQFPLTFDRALFQGFVSFATMGFPAAAWLFAAALGVMIVVMIYLFVREEIAAFNFLSVNKNSSATETVELENHSLFKFSIKMLYMMGAIFLGFLAVFIVIMLSTKAGKEAAKHFQAEVNDKVLKEQYIQMKIPEDSFNGYSILCNQNQCAYLVGGASKVVSLVDVKSQMTKIDK